MTDRLWEVDAVRGIAVLLMIVFNWSYTLRFLNVYTVMPQGNWLYWDVFPRFIASLFLFLVGVALTLSFHRFKDTVQHWREKAAAKYGRRGVKIFGYGLVITAATYVFNAEMTVFFGILHLIGVAILVAYPFIAKPRRSLLAAAVVFALTPVVSMITVPWEVLAAFGFTAPVSTFDLFPLLPWTGVVFLGITAGHILYPSGCRRIPVKDTCSWRPVEKLRHGLAWLGRYSLEAYVLHQPVLLAALFLTGVPLL